MSWSVRHTTFMRESVNLQQAHEATRVMYGRDPRQPASLAWLLSLLPKPRGVALFTWNVKSCGGRSLSVTHRVYCLPYYRCSVTTDNVNIITFPLYNNAEKKKKYIPNKSDMFHGWKEKFTRFLRCMLRRLNTKRKYTYKNYPYVYEIKLKSDEKPPMKPCPMLPSWDPNPLSSH